MIDNKDIIKRLNYFIEYKNITIWALEKKSGITKNSINNAIVNESRVGVDKIANIIANFPELSPKWLLTGVGEMIEKGDSSEKNIQIAQNINGNNHQSISDCEKENKHLRELLAEKERTINILLKQIEK